jgi:hypothetical protein
MATRVAALNETNATDADFRAWCSEIHNALIAFGWTQTADTGQMNFATVLHPTTSGAIAGFAIYQMGDSLQATCPVFLKIRFGSSTQSAEPAVRLSIAIGGTDGAGNLTGGVMAEYYMNNNFGAGGLSNMLTAGTSSSFRFCWRWASTARIMCFAIERDLDATGAETNKGVQFVGCNAGTGFQSLFIDNETRAVSTVEGKWYALLSAQASQTAGGNTGVSPVRTAFGQFKNPMKTMLLYAKADFTDQTTQSITHYGAAHTYRMTNPASNMTINGINTTCGIAMLWE